MDLFGQASSFLSSISLEALNYLPLATEVDEGPISKKHISDFLSAITYSGVGIVLFALVFFMIVKFTPFSVRKEIEEDQNTSLAILIGSVFIGIAIIIAASIAG